MSAFLKAVFDWSVKNSSPYESNVAVDPEKMAWLSNAWDQLVTDGATLLKNCIGMLRDTKVERAARLEILDHIASLVEDIDNANVLRPLGGWEVMFDIIKNAEGKQSSDEMAACLMILTHVIRNNDQGVKDALDQKIVEFLYITFLHTPETYWDGEHTSVYLGYCSLILNLLQSNRFVKAYKEYRFLEGIGDSHVPADAATSHSLESYNERPNIHFVNLIAALMNIRRGPYAHKSDADMIRLTRGLEFLHSKAQTESDIDPEYTELMTSWLDGASVLP